MEYLPVQIGEAYLYRESGLFVMESLKGFRLECNMKFHICTFEISGNSQNIIKRFMFNITLF